MKAIPWQPVCCIAIADVIASSKPQSRGSCCFWLPHDLTWWLLDCPHRLLLQRKLFVSISQKAISFFLPQLMRKSYEKSAKDTFLSQWKDVQTGLFVRVCIHKIFAVFVIMTLVFHLFIVLHVSCECDYLYYKCDLRLYERDHKKFHNTSGCTWILWIMHAWCLSSYGFPINNIWIISSYAHFVTPTCGTCRQATIRMHWVCSLMAEHWSTNAICESGDNRVVVLLCCCLFTKATAASL